LISLMIVGGVTIAQRTIPARGGDAMELNEYAVQVLADAKLREARAQAARRALVARARRRSLRARLGLALIAAGERLLVASLPVRPSVTGASHG
jgi:hypothetical protein